MLLRTPVSSDCIKELDLSTSIIGSFNRPELEEDGQQGSLEKETWMEPEQRKENKEGEDEQD